MKSKDLNKKSLLIISQYFYPEEFGINNFAEKFAQKGYEIKVLTQSPSYPFDQIYDGYDNNFFQQTNYKNIKVYSVKNILGNNRGFIFSIIGFKSSISPSWLLTVRESSKILLHTDKISVFVSVSR